MCVMCYEVMNMERLSDTPFSERYIAFDNVFN